MTLTISNTIIDEEFRVVNPSPTFAENDTSPLSTSVATALDVLFDVTPTGDFYTSPTGFPQYAEKTSFVSTSNVVTNYFLTSSGTGTPFPVGGVATDLMVGNQVVSLYGTADDNIVVGRIGGADGDIVLFIAIEENKTGSVVTSADLWLGLYAPLTHADGTKVDSLDTLNLADLLYLGSTYDTTTQIPFENFNGVPSGNNLFNVIFPSDGSAAVQLLLTGSKGETLSTVNVSTTGVGAGSQHIDVGATLRIDTVQGMIQSTVNDAPEVNNANNIVYTDTADPGTDPRVEIVAADFEVTQLNPGATPERVTILVSAFNAVGAAQHGAYLTDAIASDGVAVEIDAADVIVRNGAGQDITASLVITQQGNSVLIAGLDDGTSASKTDGYQVFFTTDGVRFDRILITNMDSDGTTLDLGNFHVTTVEGGINTEYAELGSHIIYEDDGPNIDPSGSAIPDLEVDEALLGTPDTSGFAGLFTTPDYGADGAAAAGALTYDVLTNPLGAFSGLIDTATGHQIWLFVEDNPAYPGDPDASPHVVVGYEVSNPSDPGGTKGAQDFVISAEEGDVTLLQSRSVYHDKDTADTSVSFATADLVTLKATVTDADGDTDFATVPIGIHFTIVDDVPQINPSNDVNQPNNLLVDNTVGATDSSFFLLDPGADLPALLQILGPDTTGDFRFSFFDTDGIPNNEIHGTSGGAALTPLYDLVLNADGTYEFTLTGELPGTTLNLSTAEIKAGGPDTNSIQVGALENDDYVVITGDSSVGAGNINESHAFVGVDNGNLDAHESLAFTLFDGSNDPIYFEGLSIGTKSAQASHYEWDALLTDGTHIHNPGGAAGVLVPKNGTIFVSPDLPGDELIASITVTKVDGSATKIGVGDIDIFLPAQDLQLDFGVRLTDGDHDYVDTSFLVQIDGNHDGLITNPVIA